MKITIYFVSVSLLSLKGMQQEETDSMAPKQKDIASPHPQALILVLVYNLAAFALIGALLANTDIIQWNWVIKTALSLFIISGIGWIIHTMSAFKLSLYGEGANWTIKFWYISGGVAYYPCLIVATVLSIAAMIL